MLASGGLGWNGTVIMLDGVNYTLTEAQVAALPPSGVHTIQLCLTHGCRHVGVDVPPGGVDIDGEILWTIRLVASSETVLLSAEGTLCIATPYPLPPPPSPPPPAPPPPPSPPTLPTQPTASPTASPSGSPTTSPTGVLRF